MKTLTINKDALRHALECWEIQARTGRTCSAAEAAALPLQQVVDQSTDSLWSQLESAQPPNQPPQVLCSAEQLERAMHLFLVLINGENRAHDGAPGADAGLPPDVIAQKLVGRLWLMLLAVSGGGLAPSAGAVDAQAPSATEPLTHFPKPPL